MDDPDSYTHVNCEADQYSVDAKKIQAIANFVCTALGFRCWELSVTFVNSDEIQSLNAEFRNIDKSTDVLSFPQQEWVTPVSLEHPYEHPAKKKSPIPFMLGDLVISIEDAARNAHDIGHSLEREIGFLMVHGLLHLCGHDHMTPPEEETMTAQQRKLMQKMTDDFTPPLWECSVHSDGPERESAR